MSVFCSFDNWQFPLQTYLSIFLHTKNIFSVSVSDRGKPENQFNLILLDEIDLHLFYIENIYFALININGAITTKQYNWKPIIEI